MCGPSPPEEVTLVPTAGWEQLRHLLSDEPPGRKSKNIALHYDALPENMMGGLYAALT
jgi:hypothetical protein